MGKMKNNDSINKEYNLEQVLGALELCIEIANISIRDLNDVEAKQKVIEKLDKYYGETHDKESEIIQSGRVWFLIKKQDEQVEVLQVAQALDINKKKGYFGELYSHVVSILDKKDDVYGKFANELHDDGQLIFYELKVEEYLRKYAPLDYMEFVYKMAREYFAEASFAYFTQARHWKFYNSGMDKRAYYYLMENIKTKKIDEQK